MFDIREYRPHNKFDEYSFNCDIRCNLLIDIHTVLNTREILPGEI